MAKKKQIWKAGDVFEIELEDGAKIVGQVFQYKPQAMNSVICGYTLKRSENCLPLQPEDFISIQFTTRDCLDRSRWPVILNSPIPEAIDYSDLLRNESTGFVGTTVLGCGIMKKFLDACCGLRAWDSFADPEYFDKLLLKGTPRPKAAFFEKSGV